MTYKYRESLITYLVEFPDSEGEIDRLRGDGILSREEAVVVSMRVAVTRLERKLNSILEKPDSLKSHEGLHTYRANRAVG